MDWLRREEEEREKGEKIENRFFDGEHFEGGI